MGIKSTAEDDDEVEHLVEVANKFRAQLDAEFGWKGKSFAKDRQESMRRAATHLSCLLLAERATKSDARSELLHAKVIALLFPGYRSHSEQLFRLHRGVFKRTPSFAMQDLDFFDNVCQYSQAVWLAQSWKQFQPAPDSCKNELSHVVHHIPSTFVQYGLRFTGGETWCGEMVNLLARLITLLLMGASFRTNSVTF